MDSCGSGGDGGGSERACEVRVQGFVSRESPHNSIHIFYIVNTMCV